MQRRRGSRPSMAHQGPPCTHLEVASAAFALSLCLLLNPDALQTFKFTPGLNHLRGRRAVQASRRRQQRRKVRQEETVTQSPLNVIPDEDQKKLRNARRDREREEVIYRTRALSLFYIRFIDITSIYNLVVQRVSTRPYPRQVALLEARRVRDDEEY